MRDLYERALDWALDAGPVMLFVLAATIALNFFLFAVVPKGFFPTEDTGQMIGGLQTDQMSSFKMTSVKIRQFAGIIQRDPSVQTVVAFAGNNAAGGFMIVGLKPRSKEKGGADAVIQRLRPKLSRVSGASLFLNPVQDVRVGGRQSNATYQYTLKSDSLATLRLWATKLSEALKTQAALADVNTDQLDHGLESFVTVDRDKAGRLGVTNTNLDNTLYDAFGERQVSTIYQETNQYYVVMEAAPAYTQDPTALNYIYISTGAAAPSATSSAAPVAEASSVSPAVSSPSSTSGGATSTSASSSSTSSASSTSTAASVNPNAPSVANVAGQPGAVSSSVGADVAVGTTAVAGPAAPLGRAASQGVAVSITPEQILPLSAFARWADNSTPTAINHQDTQPATTISFNLAPGRSLSDATRAVAQSEADIGMPTTVHGSFQGTARVFQQSLSNEPVLIVAALVAIYIVLGVLYESYIHPLTVLSTLPSAGVGAVIALIVFHIEFTIISLIGLFLLIGIIKKNAILMIDFALDAERQQGLSPHDAIRQAALIRFRPIMMTTFAAILGALPLAIGWGEGAELRRPLGVTVIGGLLVSQVITLLTTPVVYLYLDRLRRRDDPFIRRPRGREGAPVTA
jgi:multidrug efflux pump